MAGIDQSRPDLRAAARAVRLTLLGLWAERVVQAFWPLFTVLMVVLAVFLFGLDARLPIEAWWITLLAGVIASGTAAWRGIRRFETPTLVEARDRVDLRLPGRPLAAINDAMALGQGDEASREMWEAHQRRMAERAAKAERVAPDFRIARRDPYALRHLATLALVAGILFGGAFRLSQGGPLVDGVAAANSGPTWEGWIDPPSYTRKPGLYLADQTGSLGIPVGSRITLRLYGNNPPEVSQNVADTPIDPAAKSLEFTVTKSGTLSIGDDEWEVIATPDAPPEILADGEAERAAGGEMRLKFMATDDYGVIAAQAVMALDLSRVDRRYGLTLDPEVTEAIIVDLPMPIAGDRKEIAGLMAEDFSKHPWAGQPVTLTLTATDEAAQDGASAGIAIILEGKRFFDPLASAIAEQRRDLIWNRQNGPRVAQVLRAASWHPDDLLIPASVFLRLKVVIRELEIAMAAGPLTDEARDNVAEVLWQIANDIEEGKMADALERLRKAQEKLAEAIKNGASDEEIAELTQDMREAMRDYIQQLAENAPPSDQQQAENGQPITQDQLNQMMNKLQELMEEGRDEEAQALLDQLMQMMENMQVTQSEGGGEGDQAMKGLSDTLKEQQDLSDDTFQDRQQGPQGQQQDEGQNGQGENQQRPGQGQQQGQTGPDGQQDGTDGGQQGQDGPGGQSLAERQQALRRMLNDQASRVPGLGGQEAEDLRRSLDNAGRAMDRAEESLRNQDFAGALDNQAEAMEQLREGLRDLGEMLAEQNPGEGRQGDAESKAEGKGDRDPLGRDMGTNGRRIGTDERLLQGDDVYRRARELLDEIRRRSSDQERPQIELDYLKRLLDQF